MRTIEPMIVLAIRDALACLSDAPTIPYLPHPMEVCRLVLACGGSQLSACAAVLHEVVALGQLHASVVEQRYGRAVAEKVQVLCRQSADDEEGLLLLCADRVSHLVRWAHMTPPESVARELNALHLSLRRLEPSARQFLTEQLESVQAWPVLHVARRSRLRAARTGVRIVPHSVK